MMASLPSSQDSSVLNDHSVQVIIRVRPLSAPEISSQGNSKCIKHESNNVITWTGQPESRFTFDFVANETVSQEELFNLAGISMVENCMGGYNSCMFAYGQTGSGKTHTMLGDIEGGTRRHSVNCGMTPRIFEYLFSRIQKEKEIRKDEHLSFTCKCSFLEIYNEQILDLLDPSSSNLQIREDLRKGVYVENLKEIEIRNAREVLLHLIQGAANRKVAATNMNHASSRSHSVFTCIIESKWESQGVSHHRFARLNLVDLAGSERQKSSGAEGERLKEATNINKSLSTLGLVIMNLVSISNGKSLHVPYRDSKLTFLLQDSLGGNSKTTIIANISPSLCCSLETLSTLKFAQRAKFIKNNAIINEDASGDVIAMRSQIQQLKKEVDRLRGIAYDENRNKLDDLSMMEASISVGGFLGETSYNEDSPFASETKRLKKSDSEIALVGAYRTIKDKDASIQSLTAENQALVHLAKQRADEIQSLKLRLRFREAAIKRMEGAVIGKLSAEKHFLAERDEHVKEIEVLRNQVDRNQEVTRFAMENLQLKEEIRKFKSLTDGGETDLMKQQVAALQNKLLEALDWKLMHEPSSSLQESLFEKAKEADDLSAVSNQKSASPSPGGENSAIRVQLEKDALQKQLEFCYTEKEQLERHVNDLIREIGIERARNEQLNNHTTNLAREIEAEKSQKEHFQRQVDDLIKELNAEKEAIPTASYAPDINDLKTMVDVISTASQREAEAHNKTILLLKENEALEENLSSYAAENSGLLDQLKAAIDEKNRLLQIQERSHNSLSKLTSLHDKTLSERDQLQTHQQRFKDAFSQLYKACTEHSHLENIVRTKQHDAGLYKSLLSEADDRATVSHNKLVAYKGVVSSVRQLEEEECRVRANLGATRGEMEARVVEMERLMRKKNEAEIMIILNENLKRGLEKHYYVLQCETEARKQKNERMLVAIENHVKASDLLSSQEENSKLLSEKRTAKQRLMSVKKVIDEIKSNYRKIKREMEWSEGSFKKLSEKFEEGEAAVGEIREKREALSFCEGHASEVVLTYQECLFNAGLRRLEISVLEEELGELFKRVDDVRSLRLSLTETIRCLVAVDT